MGTHHHPRQPDNHEQQQGAASTDPEASSRLDGSIENVASVPAPTVNYPIRQKGQEKRERQRNLQNPNAPSLAPFQWEWNGNKQGATNSDTPYDPTVTFEGAYPTEYWCDKYLPFAKTDEIYVVGETEIPFDVEASFPKTADVASNVRALEWSVLDSVVTHIGLDVCRFDLQREEQGSRGLLMDGLDDFMAMVQPSTEEQLRRRAQILTYPTIIYRLSSMPPDQIGAPDDCTYLAYDDTKETCLAIRGVITARFAGIDKDTSLEVDEYLQSVLKNVIEADDSGIRVMNIRNVIYTSDRIPPNSSKGDVQVIQGAARASGGSGGTILLSAILSVSLLFLCVGSIFIVRRRRREEEVSTTSARNLEVPSTSAELEEARSHDSSGASADTAASVQGEDAPDTAKLDALGVTSAMTLSISMSSSGEAAPYADTPDSAKDAAYVAATKTAESRGERAQNSSSESGVTPTVAPTEEKLTVLPAELPPRPPALLPRTQSKKLKKRRKKKKKKKKAILQRVNSRENVAAMQAIQESEEDEDSEMGSEYGDSECSTDDDSSGLKSGPSSGCNTPVRSLSRGNSRSNSPMLSAQDELFPSDVFADLDYTFDIEAPDLLAETAKMKLSDGTNMQRASLPRKRSARKQKLEGDKEDIPNLPPVNSGLPPLPPSWV